MTKTKQLQFMPSQSNNFETTNEALADKSEPNIAAMEELFRGTCMGPWVTASRWAIVRDVMTLDVWKRCEASIVWLAENKADFEADDEQALALVTHPDTFEQGCSKVCKEACSTDVAKHCQSFLWKAKQTSIQRVKELQPQVWHSKGSHQHCEGFKAKWRMKKDTVAKRHHRTNERRSSDETMKCRSGSITREVTCSSALASLASWQKTSWNSVHTLSFPVMAHSLLSTAPM
mmetsp:Transcript_16033/g.26498  ORF Transcript_16033/g.26498 Transcript_16033/m.26498 type:complete len:232 (+) Transcript_16033:197-892(+)